MAELQKLKRSQARQSHLQNTRSYESELAHMRCEIYNDCIKKRKQEKLAVKKRQALEQADAAIKLNAEELLAAVSDIGRAHRDAEEAKRIFCVNEQTKIQENRQRRSRVQNRTIVAANRVRASEHEKRVAEEEKERLRTIRQNEIKTAREEARAAGDARQTTIDAARVVEVRRHTPPPIRSAGQITLDYMRRSKGPLPTETDIRVIRHVSPEFTHKHHAKAYIPLANVTLDTDNGVANEASHEDMHGLQKLFNRVLLQLKNKWVVKARNRGANSTLYEEAALAKFELSLKTLSNMDMRSDRLKKRVNQIEHVTHSPTVNIEQQFESLFIHASEPKPTAKRVPSPVQQDSTEADDRRGRDTDGEYECDADSLDDDSDDGSDDEGDNPQLSQSLKWKVFGKNDVLPVVTVAAPEESAEPETSFERDDGDFNGGKQRSEEESTDILDDWTYSHGPASSQGDGDGLDLGQTMRLPRNVTFGLARAEGGDDSGEVHLEGSSDGDVEDWLMNCSGGANDGVNADADRYAEAYAARNAVLLGGFGEGHVDGGDQGEENDLLYNLQVNTEGGYAPVDITSGPLSLDMDFGLEDEDVSPGDVNGSTSMGSDIFDPDRTFSTLNKHSAGAAYHGPCSVSSESSAIALDNIRRVTEAEAAVTAASIDDETLDSDAKADTKEAPESPEWVVAEADMAPFDALRASVDLRASVETAGSLEEEPIDPNVYSAPPVPYVAPTASEEEELAEETAEAPIAPAPTNLSATAPAPRKPTSTTAGAAAKSRLNKTVGDKTAPAVPPKKSAVPVQPGRPVVATKTTTTKAGASKPGARGAETEGLGVVKTEVAVIENKLAAHVKAKLAAPVPGAAARVNTSVSAGDALAGAIANSLSAPQGPPKRQGKTAAAASPKPKPQAPTDNKPQAIRPAPLLSSKNKNAPAALSTSRGATSAARSEFRPDAKSSAKVEPKAEPRRQTQPASGRITAISAASNLVDVSSAVVASVELNTKIEDERLEREHVLHPYERPGALPTDDSVPSISLSVDSLDMNATARSDQAAMKMSDSSSESQSKSTISQTDSGSTRTDSSSNFFEQFDTEDAGSSTSMSSASNMNTSDSFLRQITGAPSGPAVGGKPNPNDSNYVHYLHKNISVLSADTNLSDTSASTGLSELNNYNNTTGNTSRFLDSLEEVSGNDTSSSSGSSSRSSAHLNTDSSTGESDNSNVSLEELLQFNSKSDRIRQEWQRKLNSATATVEASESQAMQSLLGELSELRDLDEDVDGIVEDLVRDEDFDYFDHRTSSSGSGSGSRSGTSTSGSRYETGSSSSQGQRSSSLSSDMRPPRDDDSETADSLEFLGVERDDVMSVSGTTESTAEVQFLQSLKQRSDHLTYSGKKPNLGSDTSSSSGGGGDRGSIISSVLPENTRGNRPRGLPSSSSSQSRTESSRRSVEGSSLSSPTLLSGSGEDSALDVSSNSTPSWLLFVDENNSSIASGGMNSNNNSTLDSNNQSRSDDI